MNKRHYEHTLPNIRGSLSNTYEQDVHCSLFHTRFLLVVGHVLLCQPERGGRDVFSVVFYLKDMKTTEFFRENHRNRKNGISFGNLYFRDTAFFSFRPISFSPHSSRSAKVLFSA